MNKIDINKKMIGKRVLVNYNPPWEGKIVSVVNEENFSVLKESGKTTTVHMYDIRSLENVQ